MSTAISHCAIEYVNQQSKNQNRYLLLRLSEGEAHIYAIWILNNKTHAIETVGEDLVLAQRIFCLLVEGELSPYHLYDWMSDLKRE